MKVNDLYKIDMFAFDSKIGYITNLGTTFYEIQSQYPIGSEEYKEIDNRLKLCCTNQNLQIDAAKGLKIKPFPKCWTTYQKILETDTEEEKTRKEFENKLIIEKRPAFMKFLYPKYAKQYKDFKDNFDLYCFIMFGKDFECLTSEDKQTEKYKDMIEYYNQKNPFLETNGVMNRLSRYMQNELKHIKPKNVECDNQKIFEKLYNANVPIDNDLLEKIKVVKKEYDDFKKTKQLKTSEFSTYEQYYKYLRNKCLQEISNNIQELANLAVYLCYSLNPNKPKDFCWDIFGGGIVENLKEKHPTARIPMQSPIGEVEYLGEKYTFVDFDYNNLDNGNNFDLDDSCFDVFDDIDDFEGEEENVDF